MIPHRRRDFAAGNHFSFSHPPRAADAMGEYNAWAERIKGANHGYFARSPDPNPGAWARRPDQIRRAGAPPPPTTELGGGDPIRSAAAAAAAEEQGFRWAAKESYDSDTPSPPLWKSPPIARSAGSSPIRSVYHDDGDDDDDRGRYPNQRAHTIEKYRQEMMEMVRGLPEAAYELSLRDIVESPFPRIARIDGQRSTDEAESPKEKSEKGASQTEKETKKEKKKKKKKKKVGRISRSESLDTGGLLIKMFMPLSVGGRRKSFGASSAATGAKVSPKPAAATAAAAAAAGEGNNKGEEWWNKNEFSEPESSRTSSTNSSSSSGSSKSGSRSRGRRMSSCYSFFRSSKSRSRRS